MKNKKDKEKTGPSVNSNLTNKEQEWHAVTSDDEEAYVHEMEQLYKD